MLTDKKSLLLYIKRIFYLIYIDFDYTVQLGKQRSIEHTLGFNYKYTHILKSSKLHSNTQTVQIIEQERLKQPRIQFILYDIKPFNPTLFYI